MEALRLAAPLRVLVGTAAPLPAQTPGPRASVSAFVIGPRLRKKGPSCLPGPLEGSRRLPALTKESLVRGGLRFPSPTSRTPVPRKGSRRAEVTAVHRLKTRGGWTRVGDPTPFLETPGQVGPGEVGPEVTQEGSGSPLTRQTSGRTHPSPCLGVRSLERPRPPLPRARSRVPTEGPDPRTVVPGAETPGTEESSLGVVPRSPKSVDLGIPTPWVGTVVPGGLRPAGIVRTGTAGPTVGLRPPPRRPEGTGGEDGPPPVQVDGLGGPDGSFLPSSLPPPGSDVGGLDTIIKYTGPRAHLRRPDTDQQTKSVDGP